MCNPLFHFMKHNEVKADQIHKDEVEKYVQDIITC